MEGWRLEIKIQNNASELHFMYNQPVDYTVIDDENNIFEFSIKLTTYYDCCFNRAIQTLLSILKKPVSSFAEKDDKFSFCDTI